MYKVNVLSKGIHNNVALGVRYCLTRRAAKEMIKSCNESECDFNVAKFVHCCDGIFCWSETDALNLFE